MKWVCWTWYLTPNTSTAINASLITTCCACECVELEIFFFDHACWCDFSCRKYPTVHTDEERDQYKAVFNDQYAEYKELHAEVQVLAKKFEEMDNLIKSLPSQPSSQMVMLLNEPGGGKPTDPETHSGDWLVLGLTGGILDRNIA